MQLSMLLVLLLVATNAVAVAAATRTSARGGAEDGNAGALPEIAIAKPNCKDTCGNVRIPYPFGIGEGCYSRPEFNITCKESDDERETTPRLMKTRMIVTYISLEEGVLQTMQLVNSVCYDEGNSTEGGQSNGGLSLIPPYTVSSDKNMFVAVGCDTYARLFAGQSNQTYTTGCISVCRQQNISGYAIGTNNDSCSGMGCCETKIPPLLNYLILWVKSYHSPPRALNSCSFAFVVQKGKFTFNNTSFQQLLSRSITRLPLVLDWQFKEQSCEFAKGSGTLACKGNSECQDKPTGYICVCKIGFQGNPYLDDCQDIDECTTLKSPCTHGQCNNTVGNYTCICDSGYKNPEGDPIKCFEVPSTKRLKISLGVSLSFSVLLVTIFWIYRKRRKSHVKNLKKEYFAANGGARLEKKMSEMGKTARIFTEVEVIEATNNYDAKNEVGKGRTAIVYKGILDKQKVAIKKPKTASPADQNQNTAAQRGQAQEQYVDEMTVLYQINHNNVVRLVGCCFETEKPIVVCDFINHGTLYEYIHGKEGKKPPSRGLKERLEIAAETAGALAYLHHDTFKPVIHGDVKTANILLHKKDEKLTPKLSNFKASRLVLQDENQGSPSGGTKGYVDPESNSKSLTKESDVYSFGVVLAELLTSQMAISPGKPAAESELAKVFVSKVDLDKILDQEIVKGHSATVTQVADLAKRCLSSVGKERPSMREVAAVLQGLERTMEQHPSGGEANISSSPKDTSNLVVSSASVVDTTTSAQYESSMQITPV